MESLINAICRKENLPCQSLQPLGGGQVNAVYRVDDRYVLRIGQREDAGQRLERETQIMRSLAGQIPIARVLAFGQEQGHYYQIQEHMPGQKLYQVWKGLSAAEQETVAADLAASMKVMHSARFAGFGEGRPGSPAYPTWEDFLSGKFYRAVEEIGELKIRMQPGFLQLAVDYFEEHRQVLQGASPTLVHCDLNLTNILVDGGRLSAILDFEFAMQAPADYELLAVEGFCLYPNDWAEEDQEIYCTADFANLIPLLRRYDGGLFAVHDLRQRMNVYHVYAAVSSYLEWRKANLDTIPPERMAADHFYMGRVWNILYHNGARMFFA